MRSQKSRPKNGIKRAWCKKKLRQLFTVLTSSNNARVETTSKPLQLNKANILCSTILLIIVMRRPASAITPLIMVVNNASDIEAKAEKACNLLCKLALTLNKFSETKEGRTAVCWLVWTGTAWTIKATSLVVVPSLGNAALAIAGICSVAYGIETIIGSDTFIGTDFFHGANKWCVKGFSLIGVTSILPEGKLALVIKFLKTFQDMEG
jgi:hypothetical protein